MIKLFFLFFTSVLFAQYSVADVLANCSGYTLPNGISISFSVIQVEDLQGNKSTKVDVYNQLNAHAPIDFLATERCEAFWSDEQSLNCYTVFGSNYRIDLTTKTAEETFDGESVTYDKCEFPL